MFTINGIGSVFLISLSQSALLPVRLNVIVIVNVIVNIIEIMQKKHKISSSSPIVMQRWKKQLINAWLRSDCYIKTVRLCYLGDLPGSQTMPLKSFIWPKNLPIMESPTAI